MNQDVLAARRPRTLAQGLVDALGERIRDGRLSAGDKLPTEAEVMAEFGVSRTVVREAISKLQAAGMVETRHGIGTFVVGAGDASAFRIEPQQLATLRDVVAVLELRIGVESEAAGLAAQRRTAANLAAMRAALAAFAAAVEEGRDAVAADFQLHSEIARELCQRIVDDLVHTSGTASLVRRTLVERMPWRFPTIDAMAKAPSMHPRALRRRLESEGATYKDVLADVRCRLAIEYLRKTRMTTEEIASRLGYSDAANFRHAFTRWTGKTPHEYRTT